MQLRLESENQMKEVVKEYEKTISELIADNKREKTKLEASEIIQCVSWLYVTVLVGTYGIVLYRVGYGRYNRVPVPSFHHAGSGTALIGSTFPFVKGVRIFTLS